MNENEFIENGRHYIKKIRRCHVAYQIGDAYFLSCRIIQYGESYYRYIPTESMLNHVGKARRFYLCESAEHSVREAIDLYERKVSDLTGKEGIRVLCDEGRSTLFYRCGKNHRYHVLIRHTAEKTGGEPKVTLFDDLSLDELVSTLQRECSDISAQKSVFPTPETLRDFPLYRSALERQDKVMLAELEMRYGNPSAEIYAMLEKKDGVRRLPRLSSAYDKMYVVDSATVSSRILLKSGYRLLHRPCFAMKNCTHEKCQLNPYTKTGVDAAGKDDEAMPFQAFLALFDKQNESERISEEKKGR